MHYVKAKGILSAHNGMNIYRGCQHGCIYCDARSHCYQMHHVFEDIEVKENAIELLEASIKSKRNTAFGGIWTFGFGGNYGYSLRRQFDKCTPIAKFAPKGARMHPGTNFCTLYR